MLDRVNTGEIARLMVFMPPGSAKSNYGTIKFPAYYLGRNHKHGVISASYNDTLAESFGRKVRNLVGTDAYRAVFPVRLADDSKAKGEWETSEGGFYYACGVGSGVTGRRADLIVIDDPVKSREEADSETMRAKTWDWFVSDIRTRGKPGHKIVIIQTRWHEDDLSGRILPENWDGRSGWVKSRTDENWYVLSLPACAGEDDPLGREPGEWLWADYYTPEHWRMTKATQTRPPADIRNWNSLYQQQPTTEQGTYFQRDWFKRYSHAPNELNVYLTGDFAISEEATADYTELGVWGVDNHEKVYVLDWWYGQKDSLEWSDKLLEMMARWRPVTFAGERANIEKSVLPFIEREMRQRGIYSAVEMLSTTGDKAAKARSFQSLQKAGDVYWPYTDWADRVMQQMLKFPAGKHDDAVDAASVFGRLLAQVWAAAPRKLSKEERITQDHARLAAAWNAPPKFSDADFR